MKLLTSKNILNQEEFKEAQKILPDKFTNFNSILLKKEEIKNLLLLPVKNEHQRQYYKTINKLNEIKIIQEKLNTSGIFIQENQYIYFLPPDLKQMIIWLFDDTSDDEIYKLIKDYLNKNNLNEADVICFERPRNINIPLIQGTIKQIRHIHLWHEKF